MTRHPWLDDDEDSMDAARGAAAGLIIGVMLWIAAGVLIWIAVR